MLIDIMFLSGDSRQQCGCAQGAFQEGGKNSAFPRAVEQLFGEKVSGVKNKS